MAQTRGAQQHTHTSCTANFCPHQQLTAAWRQVSGWAVEEAAIRCSSLSGLGAARAMATSSLRCVNKGEANQGFTGRQANGGLLASLAYNASPVCCNARLPRVPLPSCGSPEWRTSALHPGALGS